MPTAEPAGADEWVIQGRSGSGRLVTQSSPKGQLCARRADIPGVPIHPAENSLNPDIHATNRSSLSELARRANRGAFLHLPLWLLISAFTGLYGRAPAFCWFNGLGILAFLLVRLALQRAFTGWVNTRPTLAQAFKMGSV